MEQKQLSKGSMSAKQFAELILTLSITLLESGAHCERVSRNVKRMAKAMQYDVDLLLSFTAISVSVSDKLNTNNFATANRQIAAHGVHFGIFTSTSMLTWEFVETTMSIDQFRHKIADIKKIAHYPDWLVRLFIGISCACLCLLSAGGYIDALFAFVAATIGLTIRQILHRRGYNLMIVIGFAAFVTTCIAGTNVLLQLGTKPSVSVATAVLYLIPGVPLINCIIDLMEGYIPTGIARGAYGGFILLCIAIGMFLSMSLIGIKNF